MRTLGNEGAGEWVTVGRGTSGAIAGTASYVVLSAEPSLGEGYICNFFGYTSGLVLFC